MQLSDYLETSEWYSGKLSDVARQLAFAGIAVVWVFKISNGTLLTVPKDLIPPLVLFVAGLGFDLLQYMAGAIVWGLFVWVKEKKHPDASQDPELERPSCLKLPISTFFVLKLIAVVCAYYLLIKYFWSIWK
jgi:hypothetical protein